ncbi:GRRM system radical SAM/SPASM domain protein [Streptomyces chumphonensis]|uniref:GRRM system radical SAM/SPASM domain protein n=1 Tax=Streptomyces chumphonensis TaxID=1214925 RepID=A0A927EWT4_9ACTN|nr:cyclophane-forming radical SAM/SPASM peptide maturase GrrM/OscB [Streptomyces chumphonensis]MBD3930432.1 GRRM system radical SAM/SPASM domain protein [Streptomyces chumphonensis]
MESIAVNTRGGVQHVVLQATPFCNIACTYCYLPDRSRFEVMRLEVVDAVAELLASAESDAEVLEVRWHAGEPLTAGPSFYAEAVALMASRLSGRYEVRHSVQTNAILVDRDWCRLFKNHSFRVGVSIDGPEEINDAHRLTRRGEGSFRKAMRGVARLREEGVPFDTISVVTPATLGRQERFLDFLENLAPRSVGFNVEETEGSHQSASLASADFEPAWQGFLERLVGWEKRTGIPVREFDRIRRSIAGSGFGAVNEQARPFGFINVDVDGNLYTFSPELVGLTHSAYGSFAIGDVWTPWPSLHASASLKAQATSIADGVEGCRRRCEYFSVCGGGAPANKLFENGTFDSDETAMCRCTVKDVTDVVVRDIEASTGHGE